MIHKGNIANITITPADVVDCVIGGSPCQGLSVAGKRLGLSDERSGLFMEQIRIIKEMREVDKRSGRSGINVRPRWGVWENVPGALSSGTPKGEDFRIVLEEFIKIADPTATVPRPARGGWNNSGCIVGDGYSLAWRIMDARYHGVPQRRRRITLIVDFAGDGASKVLFNEEGMRWDFETSQRAWKAIAPYFKGSPVGSAGGRLGYSKNCLNPNDPQSMRLFSPEGFYQSLYAREKSGGENSGVVYSIDGNVCDRVSKKNGCGYSENVSPTLNTQDRHAVVYDARGNGDGETSPNITGDHSSRVTDYTPIVTIKKTDSSDERNYKGVGNQFVDDDGVAICIGNGQVNQLTECDLSRSLDCMHDQQILIHRPFYTSWDGYQTAGTLTAKGDNQRMPDKGNFQGVIGKMGKKYIVRRLTPLECSRLQGMPDGWCNIPEISEADAKEQVAFWIPFWNEWSAINGKKPKTEKQILKWLTKSVSESAQYQMYGNGIALPQWVWTCGRIIETYKGINPTMASLFDGTGSFPLVWNSILGGAYTVWSSEVNPDAVRVSKYRMQERGW